MAKYEVNDRFNFKIGHFLDKGIVIAVDTLGYEILWGDNSKGWHGQTYIDSNSNINIKYKIKKEFIKWISI